jgi:hypothetical protein
MVGGLLGGASQRGQGFGGYIDFLFNSGKKIAETFSGHKIPGTLKDGKLVFDKNAIPQSGEAWFLLQRSQSRICHHEKCSIWSRCKMCKA